MKKTLLVLSSLLAASLLASCMATDGGGESEEEKTTSSQTEEPSTSESQVTTSEVPSTSEEEPSTSEEESTTSEEESSIPESETSSSDASEDIITLPALHIAVFEGQVTDETKYQDFKTSFATYLVDSQVAITNLTWDLVGASNVASLGTDVETWNTKEDSPYLFDCILGAKGNIDEAHGAGYIADNYTVYKDEGGSTVSTFVFGGKTDRRFYTLNETENSEAVAILLEFALGYSDIVE